MPLTNMDSVSLSGNTSMFESVRGGGKRRIRNSKRVRRGYHGGRTRIKRKTNVCTQCKKRTCRCLR